MSAPELRRDPVVGRWIILSPDRSRRPGERSLRVDELQGGNCPFCPGNESRTPDPIFLDPSRGEWRRRVFRSAAPVVSPDVEIERHGEGMFDMASGFGEHEVIVDARGHEETLAGMPPWELAELVKVWRGRFHALMTDPRFRYLTLFGNRGAAAGATISHSHSQIIATPLMPRIPMEEISRSYDYFQAKERCVFCDALEGDTTGERLVWRNASFAVITPFAPRFPFECWVLPFRHASHFEKIDDDMARLFGEALGAAFHALREALDDPPYSYVLHTAPTHEKGMAHYHWHLEIMPRITNVAGFEWGTGFHINPTSPESAAQMLREAISSLSSR